MHGGSGRVSLSFISSARGGGVLYMIRHSHRGSMSELMVLKWWLRWRFVSGKRIGKITGSWGLIRYLTCVRRLFDFIIFLSVKKFDKQVQQGENAFLADLLNTLNQKEYFRWILMRRCRFSDCD